MARDYPSAKRTALGFQAAAGTERGAGGVRLGQIGAGLGMEELSVLLCEEKGLEPPEEQAAQKAVLMLFDEYDDDQAEAVARLDGFVRLLEENDLPGILALVESAPCADWLSCVFLDTDALERLHKALGAADAPVKAALHDHFLAQKARLTSFTNLMEAFAERTGEA